MGFGQFERELDKELERRRVSGIEGFILHGGFGVSCTGGRRFSLEQESYKFDKVIKSDPDFILSAYSDPQSPACANYYIERIDNGSVTELNLLEVQA